MVTKYNQTRNFKGEISQKIHMENYVITCAENWGVEIHHAISSPYGHLFK